MRFNMTVKALIALFVISSLVGCAIYVKGQLDAEYGTSQVQNRLISSNSKALEYHQDIKPILEQRCVVCHGCYDAPCQLKLESFEGLDRGTSKDQVYNGARLLAAETSRILIDGDSTQAWRSKEFFPVLNERNQTPTANLEASVLYRSLALKKSHPLPDGDILPDSFDFGLERNQQCPNIEEFSRFESKYPLWGMPYGLPAIEESKFAILTQWLAEGGKTSVGPSVSAAGQEHIVEWEKYLNGNTLKQQLMSRYIYEHLYAGHIYFDAKGSTEFFDLLRSSTPPGEPLKLIVTRRPYDDPGVERVYYRLRHINSTIIDKNHMPYLLNEKRKRRWDELFIEANYQVTELPSYEPEVAANPFVAFKELPVNSRYKFMLDEAQYTIMGFIKGPVCRGQVALNVINDRFWVMFVEPDEQRIETMEMFLAQYGDEIKLPSEQQSNVYPVASWLKYSKLHKDEILKRQAFIKQRTQGRASLELAAIWDGEGNNKNATLTVFRHFDSATVLKGFVGKTPKTAWLIDYTLLEKIHYLLVAGFDVYGNVGHQLVTRLYFDFLRMEGENNFLMLLPKDVANQQLNNWYRDAESEVQEHLDFLQNRNTGKSGINYQSDDPKNELFHLVRKHLGKAINEDSLNQAGEDTGQSVLNQQLQQLASIKGKALSFMPELSFLRLVDGNADDKAYTLILNRAHSNVASLFGEESRLLPDEHTLTLVKGVVGSYPNSFLQVSKDELKIFVDAISSLDSEESYRLLIDKFGIRRTSKSFWANSDWINQHHLQTNPIEAGLLDYNRLENR